MHSAAALHRRARETRDHDRVQRQGRRHRGLTPAPNAEPASDGGSAWWQERLHALVAPQHAAEDVSESAAAAQSTKLAGGEVRDVIGDLSIAIAIENRCQSAEPTRHLA